MTRLKSCARIALCGSQARLEGFVGNRDTDAYTVIHTGSCQVLPQTGSSGTACIGELNLALCNGSTKYSQTTFSFGGLDPPRQ